MRSAKIIQTIQENPCVVKSVVKAQMAVNAGWTRLDQVDAES